MTTCALYVYTTFCIVFKLRESLYSPTFGVKAERRSLAGYLSAEARIQ